MTNPKDQCCCHCGQPHKEGVSYSIIIAGKEQTMCCPGCQAVASLIADQPHIDLQRCHEATTQGLQAMPLEGRIEGVPR